jgi:hypothetical protein
VTTPAVAQRAACPACGAATRPGDPWCTLCYADLSGATAPEDAVAPSPGADAALPVPATRSTKAMEPVADDEEAAEPAGADAVAAPDASPLDAVTMPCPTCETPVPVLVGTCPVCGTDMLAPLRGVDPAQQSQFVRELMAMSRAARLSMAAGLAVALLILIFGVTAIV